MIETYLIDKLLEIKQSLRNRRKNAKVLYGIVILTLLLVSLIFPSFYKNFITEDTLFWLFSSLIQGFAGLSALLGAIGLFKLGKNESGEVKNDFIRFLKKAIFVIIASILFLILTPLIIKINLGLFTIGFIIISSVNSLESAIYLVKNLL